VVPGEIKGMNDTRNDLLPIAVDAMGADFGPEVVVQGAIDAYKTLKIVSLIVGDETQIRAALKKYKAEELPIQIHHTSEVITMDDSPSAAIRGKPNSSIRVAFELVKKGVAAAVVSPGNTGAVMAAGLYVSGSLPGIARPAIASLIPKGGDAPPTVLLDSGANVDCRAHQLVQFALMGSLYARSVLSRESPRVALLSNGSEMSKGNDVVRAAAVTLSEMKDINFIGYVEGRDLARDVVDVAVCDGFVGNLMLKAMEGTVELVFKSMKHYVARSLRGKLGLWIARPVFRALFREKLDPSAYGGAPLLGLNDVAIICHGSSNSRAIMNAIRVAKKFVDDGLIIKLNAALTNVDQPGVFEEGIWNRMGQHLDRLKKPKKTAEKEGAKEVGGT
jgi:phosphate acyltransferase